MFKPELWQSHDEYRTIVNSLGRRLSRNNPRYQFDAYTKERQKLLSLNLDPLSDYLTPFFLQKAVPLYIRRRSCAPSSSLPCFSTGLMQKPV